MKYCECKEPDPEVNITMEYMYCEKCGLELKKGEMQ